MQSQEEEAAITEQDLELIKERETAIRQLEVRGRLWLLFGLGVYRYLETFLLDYYEKDWIESLYI